jgi:hypothetical protein
LTLICTNAPCGGCQYRKKHHLGEVSYPNLKDWALRPPFVKIGIIEQTLTNFKNNLTNASNTLLASLIAEVALPTTVQTQFFTVLLLICLVQLRLPPHYKCEGLRFTQGFLPCDAQQFFSIHPLLQSNADFRPRLPFHKVPERQFPPLSGTDSRKIVQEKRLTALPPSIPSLKREFIAQFHAYSKNCQRLTGFSRWF